MERVGDGDVGYQLAQRAPWYRPYFAQLGLVIAHFVFLQVFRESVFLHAKRRVRELLVATNASATLALETVDRARTRRWRARALDLAVAADATVPFVGLLFIPFLALRSAAHCRGHEREEAELERAASRPAPKSDA